MVGHASLWACGFGHRSGLVVPGRVQSIGAGPGGRGLVGAVQLDARIPKLPYKKKRQELVILSHSIMGFYGGFNLVN